MGLYNILVRPFIRRMELERASKFSLRYFEIVEKIPGSRRINRLLNNNGPQGLEQEVFGLSFYNPVGIGSGLDRNGTLYNALNNFGVSYVEIGPMDADGVRRALRQIQKDPQNDILAVCINADFLTAFTLAYDFCDFFVFDISADPHAETLDPILEARLAEEVYKPVIIKLPKRISDPEIEAILDYGLMNGIDGIEARNMDQVRLIASRSARKMPVIANTHIDSPGDAGEALKAGASLVAVRNGFVREGPQFVQNILKHLSALQKNERNHPKTPRNAAQE